jgi:large subunit ribosomal protein L13
MRQTTFSKGKERRWFLVDAEGATLGRIASRIATKLMGKDKPTFNKHSDDGDSVIVINAKNVKVTGKKLDKPFYWHTGWAGGIKQITIGERLESKFPERVLIKSVERMLGKGPLGRAQLRNLKVYAGSEHPHTAQNPIIWDIKSEHHMNKRD